MGPILDQCHEADLRVGAAAATAPGPPERQIVRLLVGDIERTAVKADQPPVPVPGPLRRPNRNRRHDRIIQVAQRLPPEPRARLRDARLARHLERHRGINQPLNAFQQTAQHLAIRGLHVERQRDHVIDYDMRRQIALPQACLPRCRQDRPHLRQREGLRDHTKTDVIRYSRAFRKCRNRSCHPPFPPPQREDSADELLSEQYWG